MKIKFKHAIFPLVAIILSGCFVQPSYSPTPLIDFRQIIVSDTTDTLGNKLPFLSLFFKILDGDGNFGLTENQYILDGYDTIENNFYIKMYYYSDGEIIEFPSELLLLDGRIPWTKPVGLNEYYKATVIYNLPLSFSFTDSIKFSFYVIDNELNESNVQSTMWIPPGFRGVLADTINLIEN